MSGIGLQFNRRFVGLIPKLPLTGLPPNAAAVADNVDLRGGIIRPRRRSLPLYDFGCDAKWFMVSCECARSAEIGEHAAYDSFNNRIYLTGPYDERRVGYRNLDKGCDHYCRLGHAIPEAPTASAQGGVLDDAFTELRSYVITYGSDCEEGGASLPSNPVKADKDTPVQVTLPSFDDDEICDTTLVRIYRCMTTWDVAQGFQSTDPNDIGGGFFTPGNSEAAYFLVAVLPVGATSFVDEGDIVSADVGPPLMTVGFDRPPAGTYIAGLTDNNRLVGYTKEHVLFSEPHMPWAWHKRNMKKLGCKIRDVCVQGNVVYVATDGAPFVILDDAPCEFDAPGQRTVIETATPYPACGTHNLCTPAGLFFVSKEGVVQVSPDGTTQLITRSHWDAESWARLIPKRIALGQVGDELLIGTPSAIYVMSLNLRGQQAPEEQTLTRVCVGARHFYTDKQGTTYFMDWQGVAFQWEAADEYLPYCYRTGLVALPNPTSLRAGRIGYYRSGCQHAVGEPSSFSVYTNGDATTARAVKVPRSNKAFKLNLPRTCSYQIEVSGVTPIDSLCVGAGLGELPIAG